jgi:hypothetical protein
MFLYHFSSQIFLQQILSSLSWIIILSSFLKDIFVVNRCLHWQDFLFNILKLYLIELLFVRFPIIRFWSCIYVSFSVCNGFSTLAALSVFLCYSFLAFLIWCALVWCSLCLAYFRFVELSVSVGLQFKTNMEDFISSK